MYNRQVRRKKGEGLNKIEETRKREMKDDLSCEDVTTP